MKIRQLCLLSLFAALICALSVFTIPIGAIPISLGSFAVYITSICLGKKGALSVLIFLLLGAIGLPVFSGFRGGPEVLFGPTGGYLFGYLPCTLIIGAARDKWRGNPLPLLISMVIGTVILYTAGAMQYAFISGTPFFSALLYCALPFLPGDALKLLAAWFFSLKTKVIRHLKF